MSIKWQKIVIFLDKHQHKHQKYFDYCVDAEKFFKEHKDYCLCPNCKTNYFSFDRKHITRYVKGNKCDLTKRMCNSCTRSIVLSTFLKTNKEFNKQRCKKVGDNPEYHKKIELRNAKINNLPTYIYIAKISTSKFKIGITINLKSRLSHMKYLNYEFYKELSTRYLAANLEKQIKEKYCNGEIFKKDKLKR